MVDIVMLRPLGLVATISGAGLFLLAAPLVWLTRPTEIHLPVEWLLLKPIRYTWIDPIGDHGPPVD